MKIADENVLLLWLSRECPILNPTLANPKPSMRYYYKELVIIKIERRKMDNQKLIGFFFMPRIFTMSAQMSVSIWGSYFLLPCRLISLLL